MDVLKDVTVISLMNNLMNWSQLPKTATPTLAFVCLKVYSRVKGTVFRGSEYVNLLSEQTLWEFGRGGP